MSAPAMFSVLAPFLFVLCSLCLTLASTPAELQWGLQPYFGGTLNFLNGSIAVAAFNGADQLMYRDGSSNALLQLSWAGSSWGPATPLPIGQVGDGPGLTVSADGKLMHIFYVDNDSHRVHHLYQDTTGEYVRPLDDDLQISVAAAPTAAVSGNAGDSTICVVGPAPYGSNLFYSKRQDSGSSGYQTVSSGWTGFTQASAASIVWWNNSFHVFSLHAHGYDIVHIQSSDCISWKKVTNDYDIGFHSFAAPAAFVLPASGQRVAELRLIFRSDAGDFQQCSSFDGVNFQDAQDPIAAFTIAGAPSVTWSAIGGEHVLLAGEDLYQSGSGNLYTGIRYVSTKAIV